MIYSIFDHRNGLSIIDKSNLKDVVETIQDINPLIKRNTVTLVRSEIEELLSKKGWIQDYLVSVETKITVSFYKNNIALCIQTGNISRIYADLLKLQSLFLDGKIKAGIIIVPHKHIAKIYGSNMANFERLTNELEKVFSKVITAPMIIVGFDGEKK